MMTDQPTDSDSSRSPSEVVVETIASTTNTDPTALPPLYDAINPDALNRLFTDRPTNGTVTFSYCGHVITVSDNGEIIVQEKTEPTSTID